jgi:exo-beta-1,3-glucanase (GH17 family)
VDDTGFFCGRIGAIRNLEEIQVPGLSARLSILLLLNSFHLAAQLAPPDATFVGPYTLNGLNFSPYVDGQDPNHGPHIPEWQIRERLAIVRPYTRWVRSFGSTKGLERICPIAREMGLKCAMGAWLGKEAGSPATLAENQLQIANLIAAGQRGEVDLAIVGSEVLLRGDLSKAELLAYISQVKQALPAIPVTTADVYSVWLENPDLLQAVDIVMANYYPFWEGISVEKAVWAIHRFHQRVMAAAGSKKVIVSETGWPSGGDRLLNAVPSPVNAAYFFRNFLAWATANNVEYFYFSAFDEAWKWREGSVGPHWGVWDRQGKMKRQMQAAFNGIFTPDNWGGSNLIEGPGSPQIRFTYVAPYGDTSGYVIGRVQHVEPWQHGVVVYILVGGSWWVKPYTASPVSRINAEGVWSSDITTGGVDQLATRIAAFLVPAGYVPKGYVQDKLTALAQVEVERSVTGSISGRITASGKPVANLPIQVTGTVSALTTTAPDGRYAFYDLPAGNAGYIVVPVMAGARFDPPAQAVPNLTGAFTANFALAGCGGDFQNACRPDLIWMHRTSRTATVNHYQGEAGDDFAGMFYLASGYPDWRVVASADFDGNGTPDVVWQHDQSRAVTIHYYQGTTFLEWRWLSGGYQGWRVVGAGDFDRNGYPDLVWMQDSDRLATVHFYGGESGSEFHGWDWLASGYAGWRIAALGDFDQNGVPDVVWQQDDTGLVTVHYYGGPTGTTLWGWNWLALAQAPGWRVTGANDFDGNGVPDLVRYNESEGGQVTVVYMGGPLGNVVLSTSSLTGFSDWQPLVPR